MDAVSQQVQATAGTYAVLFHFCLAQCNLAWILLRKISKIKLLLKLSISAPVMLSNLPIIYQFTTYNVVLSWGSRGVPGSHPAYIIKEISNYWKENRFVLLQFGLHLHDC